MEKTQHGLADFPSSINVSQLERYALGWLLDGEIRQFSPHTLAMRKRVVEKLLWFHRSRGHTDCGTLELRQFLGYISSGHEDEDGRWGNHRLKKKASRRTVLDYYIVLRTLFNFLLAEEVLHSSPMAKIKPPECQNDQIQPFTQAQVQALITAAKKLHHPRRDEAIVLFLFDTGARASELCQLKIKDIDLQGRRCTVQGKGDKARTLFFGGAATKALWNYLKEEPRDDEDPLFQSDRGAQGGEALTRNGLLQLIHRLGKAAKIESARCSPHTFRHTFAVEFLRGGGNAFTLQQLLGHTSLTMTNRYVALAQADMEAQHRRFSPADRLRHNRR